MPRASRTDISLQGMVLTDAQGGSARDLGDLADVNVMVLMRHRH